MKLEKEEKKRFNEQLKTAFNIDDLPSVKFEKSVFQDLNSESLVRYGFSSDNITSSISNKINKTDLKVLANICQNLCDSNPIISAVLDILSVVTLGTDGPRPQPKVRKSDGTLDEELNKKILDLWEEYNDSAISGETVRDYFMLEEQTVDLTGNVFKVFINDESNKFRHQIRHFDTTNMDLSRDTEVFNKKKGFYINYGIKYDKNDKPISYFFKNQQEIPASQVIHYYRPKTVNQKVGLPVFSSSISTILNHKTLINSAILAATLSAQLTYWLKPNTNVNEDVRKFFTETLNDLVYQSDSGTFFLTDNRPENIAGNIVISQMTTQMSKLMLQLIASGLGLSYSTLARDLEDLNFSTSRIVARLDKLTGLKRAKKFAKSNFQKSYNRFIESIITNNLIDIDLADYENNRRKYEEVRCYISHPIFDDPQKDMNFKALALKTGVKTMKQILEEDGIDWEEQLEQASKEAQKRRELNIENDLDKIHFEINISEDEQNGEQNDK